jgi:phosphotransferase system enzyme I (PtsI)
MEMIKGIAASKGIGIGKALVFKESVDIGNIKGRKIFKDDTEEEIARLKRAFVDTAAKFDAAGVKAFEMLDEKDAQLFKAYQMVLHDPVFTDLISAKIVNDLLCAEAAVLEAVEEIIQMFQAIENEYMKQRAADIENVGKTVINSMLGREAVNLSRLDEDFILIAEDLTPADTVILDKRHIKGFALENGGVTSHTSILARTLEIPAVVGCGAIIREISVGEILVIDGEAGTLIRKPGPKDIGEYTSRIRKYNEEREKLEKLREEPAVTLDGTGVKLVGNIERPEGARAVLEEGGDGIGLFRTEFLYLDRSRLPSEAEQFQAYKKVVETMGGRPCIIRTMDIGGDKKLPCIGIPDEENPFLGYRAIRICLNEVEMFKTQIRAILRASSFGNVKMMFPMISVLAELREAKGIVVEVKDKLEKEGIEFDVNIKTGVMIEVPSAAMAADLFAREADFFSIGSNDLCQYMLAADRMSKHVNYLYDPLNIGVLRLIKQVIDKGHENHIQVGMCGEMASNPDNAAILLGFGLDEFSMVPAAIPPIKKVIRNLSFQKAKAIGEAVLTMENSKEISNYIKEESC